MRLMDITWQGHLPIVVSICDENPIVKSLAVEEEGDSRCVLVCPRLSQARRLDGEIYIGASTMWAAGL
jgi:hypothetical protein